MKKNESTNSFKKLIVSESFNDLLLKNRVIGFKGLTYTVSVDTYNVPAPPWGNCVDYDNKNLFTYNPNPFETDRVQCAPVKPSRVIHYLRDNDRITITLDWNTIYGSDFEKVLNRFIEYISVENDNCDINIIESEDIVQVYSIECGYNTGTLEDSCMRCDEGSDNLDKKPNLPYRLQEFYDHIKGLGAKVSILYALDDDGRLTGRALLWKGALSRSIDSPFDFVDRIYGNESTINAFKSYAMENGYFHKVEQSYRNNDLYSVDEGIIKDPHIQLNGDFNIPFAPYMDTLNSCDVDV